MSKQPDDSLSFKAYAAIWHAANALNGGMMPDEIVLPLYQEITTFLAHAERIQEQHNKDWHKKNAERFFAARTQAAEATEAVGEVTE